MTTTPPWPGIIRNFVMFETIIFKGFAHGEEFFRAGFRRVWQFTVQYATLQRRIIFGCQKIRRNMLNIKALQENCQVISKRRAARNPENQVNTDIIQPAASHIESPANRVEPGTSAKQGKFIIFQTLNPHAKPDSIDTSQIINDFCGQSFGVGFKRYFFGPAARQPGFEHCEKLYDAGQAQSRRVATTDENRFYRAMPARSGCLRFVLQSDQILLK